jgi:putative hemolysin
MAFFHKDFISSSVTIPDKDILASSSFKALIGIVFSVSDRATLTSVIEEHSMIQSTLVDGIKDIDAIISQSSDTALSNALNGIEMGIMRKISPDSISQSDLSFLENKTREIRNSDWYIERLHTEQSSVYEGMRNAFSNGSWLDKIISEASPEEYDTLMSFRSSLSGIDPDIVDQRIDVLEAYEETRVAIKEAKNALLSSFVYEQEEFPFERHDAGNATTEDRESDNPASAYCTRNGHTIKETEKDGKIIRNCIIDENNICEEWSFYRGECEIKEKPEK